MTLTQIETLGTAYKGAKTVLREIEKEEEPKRQEVFELGMVVGALETMLLRENNAAAKRRGEA